MSLQVIGDPVLHSKSPAIQGAMLAALGLEIPYTAHVVRRGELPQYLAWAKENGVTGFNATMPHKEELVPLMDELDPIARKCGAVNTVCIKDGKYYGFNTDCGGILRALADLGADPAGKQVLLLGAGGAAKGVAGDLTGAGARVGAGGGAGGGGRAGAGGRHVRVIREDVLLWQITVLMETGRSARIQDGRRALARAGEVILRIECPVEIL